MLGYLSERNLKDFFVAVGDGERSLEAARTRLCSISDFAPRSAFDRFDRNMSGSLSSGELCDFLRDNGVYHVTNDEAYNLICFFDSDGNRRMNF